MISGDLSQLPIERLAQLLLRQVQEDAALAQRIPANDDDMLSRMRSLPAMQREQPPRPLGVDAGWMESLEELVALALTSAQDAADLSREAHEATRRTRRGMVLALALGMFGIAVAAASSAIRWWPDGSENRMAAIAGQVQAAGTPQNRISDELAALQAQDMAHGASAGSPGLAAAAQPAAYTGSAAAAPPAASEEAALAGAASAGSASAQPAASTAPAQPTALPELPPLPTQQVRVLPAHAALHDTAPHPDRQPRDSAASTVAYTTATRVPAWPRHRVGVVLRRPERAPDPVGYSPIAMVWPAVYFIHTVQRGVDALFH